MIVFVQEIALENGVSSMLAILLRARCGEKSAIDSQNHY